MSPAFAKLNSPKVWLNQKKFIPNHPHSRESLSIYNNSTNLIDGIVLPFFIQQDDLEFSFTFYSEANNHTTNTNDLRVFLNVSGTRYLMDIEPDAITEEFKMRNRSYRITGPVIARMKNANHILPKNGNFYLELYDLDSQTNEKLLATFEYRLNSPDKDLSAFKVELSKLDGMKIGAINTDTNPKLNCNSMPIAN